MERRRESISSHPSRGPIGPRGTRRRRLAVLPASLTIWALSNAPANAGHPSSSPDQPLHRGRSVFVGLGDEPDGVGDALEATKAMAHVGRALSVSNEAMETYTFASDIIRSADINKIFDSPIATRLPDGGSALTVMGQHSGQSYVIDEAESLARAVNLARFLAFAADLDVHVDRNPIPDEELGFGIDLHVDSHTGEYTHRALGRIVKRTLEVIDPENLRRLPVTEVPYFAKRTPFDMAVASEIAETLPATSLLFDRFVELAPGLEPVSHDGIEYTRVRVDMVPRLDALSRAYPTFARYAEKIFKNLEYSAKFDYRLENGHLLGSTNLDSRARRMTVELWTRRGRIVPRDAEGTPHPEEALDLSEARSHAGRVEHSFICKALGLTVADRKVVFQTSFRDGPIAEMTAKLSGVAPPRVEGWALGIIPDWAVDAFIPGSLNGHAAHFAKGLETGSKDKGTFVRVSIDNRKSDATRVNMDAGTELISNRFIDMLMRVVQSYVWPTPEVMKDASGLFFAGNDALASDLARLERTFAHLEPSPVRPARRN